jgi:maltooligosyltrehalose trehalohydrolase
VIAAHQVVYCLQNHDQIGNRPYGSRLGEFVEAESLMAAVALLLLVPCTPMIFMGSEFASSSPFLYFTDHHFDLGELVSSGRYRAFRDFWSAIDPERWPVPDPQSEEAFVRSRLDMSEREKPGHAQMYRLFRELLRLRREDAVLCRQDRRRMLAEAPADMLVAVERWSEEETERRLLLVNFGDAQAFDVGAQEWMGEAASLSWRAMLSTAEERFAGPGVDLGGLRLDPGRPVELPERSATLWAAEG